MNIYEQIVTFQQERRRAALATIINVRGSIPSSHAAKMLVSEDGQIFGTIGGGCVEAEVWQVAKEVMDQEKPRILTFDLNHDPQLDTGLVCGGTLDIFVEPLLPRPLLYIFGAGHIGLSLCEIAQLTGFEVVVWDDREAYANRERFPKASKVVVGPLDEVSSQLSQGESASIVIVTRGHRHDMDVLRWAVTTPAHYIGMIGSKRKVLMVYRALELEGISPEQFDRVHAPIGLDIGAQGPEEIAVSIAAELIAFRRHSSAAVPQLSSRLKKKSDLPTEEAVAPDRSLF